MLQTEERGQETGMGIVTIYFDEVSSQISPGEDHD